MVRNHHIRYDDYAYSQPAICFCRALFQLRQGFFSQKRNHCQCIGCNRDKQPLHKIATLKGSTSQDFVKTVMPEAQLTATDNYDQAIQLVLQDKVHALVADYPICIVALLRYPDAGFISIPMG